MSDFLLDDEVSFSYEEKSWFNMRLAKLQGSKFPQVTILEDIYCVADEKYRYVRAHVIQNNLFWYMTGKKQATSN